MKRAGPDFCWLGLALLAVLIALAVCGPVMRESDQGGLLEGALEMARTGDYSNQGWYNYEKQYLTYWALGSVIKVGGFDEPGVDPATLVTLGNRTATIFFMIGLLTAFLLSSRRDLSFVPIVLAALLAPALMFSLPLLASNVLSASCLLVLAAVMRKRNAGWMNALGCAVLTFLVVGFRWDAALVLPLLCLLSTSRFSIGGLLRERRHWLMLAATAVATVLGTSLAEGGRYKPDAFFDPRLMGAYLFFGMGGAFVVLLWLPIRLVTSKSRRAWVMRAATGFSMLLPLAFYLPFLYTPRHFFLSVVVLLLVLLLPRGERWWQVLQRRRFDRAVLWTAVLGSALLWLFGLRFESLTKPALVTSKPTLYPTSDGFWPMGCYRGFLKDLKRAETVPIDHNQEIWAAWRQLRAKSLPPGTATVQSAGLRSLGALAFMLAERDYASVAKDADFILVAERSIGRSRPGFYNSAAKKRDAIDWDTTWLREVGGTNLRKIYVAEEAAGRERTIGHRWVARLAILKALGPDDVHLRRGDLPMNWFSKDDKGHRFACVFGTAVGAQKFADELKEGGRKVALRAVDVGTGECTVVSFVFDGGELPGVTGDGGSAPPAWIGRSVLPAFMSLSNY